ncbi:uncharacterized protein LOC113341651 [Papaver somniferum]|uniref:uncharacterized protein LOC113341651 n=1 Tax=Papaver somniferum TaxID=3469 RepID=UPI000E6F5462|nr:uncharacterized protein LOC113341651 [Papaver somniferum]
MASSKLPYDNDSSSSGSESDGDDSLSVFRSFRKKQRFGDNLYGTAAMKKSTGIITSIVPAMVATTMINVKGPHGGSVLGRRYIERDRKVRYNLIIKDSGEESKYPPSYFRCLYRMDIDLFKRILRGIHNHDDYFTQRVDASKKYSLSPLQKMMASVKMLAYGCPADYVDEYIQIGESTAVECLKRFCDAIIGVFEKQYLRKPNEDDIKKLLKEGKYRGFSWNA